MNLAKIKLWPYVFISLFFILLTPVLYPAARLSFLMPCIVVLFYQKRIVVCLWGAFFAGLTIDLFSSSTFFGLHVTSYCATAALMYPQKRHFFADNLSTLPLLTFFCAVTVTLLQVFLLYIFQGEVVLGANWLLSNGLLMPLLDAVYAFSLFQLPAVIFGKPRRRGGDFFLHTSRGG